MTGLKFSDVIVPDTENQATGGMLASRAHSTGRQTKYRAAMAVAGLSVFRAMLAINIRRGRLSPRHLASRCSPVNATSSCETVDT